jgi:hypothetical protein
MRTTLRLLRRLALPVLVAMGSTIIVNPILAAEPSEELRAIRDLLKRIDERLENSNTISLQMLEKQKAEFSQLRQELSQLRDDLSQARRDMADVKNRSLGGTSSSYFGGSAPMAPLAGTASIRLVNTYLSNMTAMINGLTYTVAPGQSTTVPLQPGSVWYQVFPVQPFPKSTVKQAGEVLTLRLYPQ